MPTDARLHGVLIGAGQFAGYHLEAWNRLERVRIGALCDLNPHNADDLAQRYGVSARFTDWREMIDSQQPDFVDIVTPPDSHHQIAQHAAAQGAHIICQRPLAPTARQAADLVRDLAAFPVRFMVHENWRWQPWYRKTRELLAADAIGEPFSLAFRMRTGEGWNTDVYLDRDAALHARPRALLDEMGTHFVDTFRFLLGEVTSVYARVQRRNPALHGEDSAVVVLGFADGQTAVLDASRYNETTAADPRLTFGAMRLDGSKGHLLLEEDGSLTVHPLGGIPELIEYEIPDQGFAGDCVYALQRHFVDALTSQLPFESEGDDFLRTVEVVEAAYEAAARNIVVSLA